MQRTIVLFVVAVGLTGVSANEVAAAKMRTMRRRGVLAVNAAKPAIQVVAVEGTTACFLASDSRDVVAASDFFRVAAREFAFDHDGT